MQILVETVLSSLAKGNPNPIHFDAVVVDEAAQAVELSALIPFKYQASATVLVGDPGKLYERMVG